MFSRRTCRTENESDIRVQNGITFEKQEKARLLPERKPSIVCAFLFLFLLSFLFFFSSGHKLISEASSDAERASRRSLPAGNVWSHSKVKNGVGRCSGGHFRGTGRGTRDGTRPRMHKSFDGGCSHDFFGVARRLPLHCWLLESARHARRVRGMQKFANNAKGSSRLFYLSDVVLYGETFDCVEKF